MLSLVAADGSLARVDARSAAAASGVLASAVEALGEGSPLPLPGVRGAPDLACLVELVSLSARPDAEDALGLAMARVDGTEPATRPVAAPARRRLPARGMPLGRVARLARYLDMRLAAAAAVRGMAADLVARATVDGEGAACVPDLFDVANCGGGP